jgi:hypothetical protein
MHHPLTKARASDVTTIIISVLQAESSLVTLAIVAARELCVSN